MALEALAAGAVAVVAKPRLGLKQFLEESRRELLQTLKAAARARPRAGAARAAAARPPAAPIARRAPSAGLHALCGEQAGGDRQLHRRHAGDRVGAAALPGDSPGIAIVQHMPEKFTAMYAAAAGRPVRDERARGARRRPPGARRGADRPGRPAHAAAQGRRPVLRGGGRRPAGEPPQALGGRAVPARPPSAPARDALGIILTGMGDDGARGMKLLHDRGARTIAQDEETCVVFGMPKEAIELGAVDEVMPLDRVARAILAFDARG